MTLTPDPELVIAKSARVCYASEPKKEGDESRLIGKLRDLGHMSVFEHALATFLIEGVSRSLTHQLVRHRLASYSQQSQRYVNEKAFEYITPPTMEGDSNAKHIFDEAMDMSRKSYAKLIDAGIPKEDARFVLPNACSTRIVVSMNFRELRHFIKLRADAKSQWEIRELAKRMLEILKEKAPNAFADL